MSTVVCLSVYSIITTSENQFLSRLPHTKLLTLGPNSQLNLAGSLIQTHVSNASKSASVRSCWRYRWRSATHFSTLPASLSWRLWTRTPCVDSLRSFLRLSSPWLSGCSSPKFPCFACEHPPWWAHRSDFSVTASLLLYPPPGLSRVSRRSPHPFRYLRSLRAVFHLCLPQKLKESVKSRSTLLPRGCAVRSLPSACPEFVAVRWNRYRIL